MPPDGPPVRCPDITRATQALGWSPTVSRRGGLGKMTDPYREHWPRSDRSAESLQRAAQLRMYTQGFLVNRRPVGSEDDMAGGPNQVPAVGEPAEGGGPVVRGDRRTRAASPPATFEYESISDPRGRRPVSAAAAFAGLGSVLGALLQFVAICGSPRFLFFHASDAAPAPGPFTRFDRLWFLLPSLTSVLLGCVAVRFDKWYGPAVLGITLAILSLAFVSLVGFAR